MNCYVRFSYLGVTRENKIEVLQSAILFDHAEAIRAKCAALKPRLEESREGRLVLTISPNKQPRKEEDQALVLDVCREGGSQAFLKTTPFSETLGLDSIFQ